MIMLEWRNVGTEVCRTATEKQKPLVQPVKVRKGFSEKETPELIIEDKGKGWVLRQKE